MGQEKLAGKSFMHKLLHDKTANTLAISAAALLPLMAMVGSGIDASRGYMTKSRLQAACDAGALAARRSMTGTVLTQADEEMGNTFFDQNFPEEMFGSTGRNREYTSDAAGVVNGTASVTLPTTIMATFGFTEIDLSVTCSADHNLSNTDIMFVLDVTGSMNCPEDRVNNCPGNGNNNETEASNSLIVGLRTAVINFHEAVSESAPATARVRYGFLPYANTVNVGFDIPTQYMATSHSYQSRGPIWNNNTTFDSYRYCRITTGQNANCGYTTPAGRNGWGSVNLTNLYTSVNHRTNMPTGVNGAMEEITWAGCIEEASTANTATLNPVPANANDLNINLIPTTEAQRWKPMLNQVVWQRFTQATVNENRITTNNVNSTTNLTTWRMSRNDVNLCVPRARKLQEMTAAEVATYINGLRARGATYHDIGMIWGARYISARGIFAADNAEAPNGQPISRHMVFMTDGQLAPNRLVYSPYGIEPWDQRVSNGTRDQMIARHEARFQAACRAAKAENITVWVVAFGTEMTNSLRNCASPNRALVASNNNELNETFQRIASEIAALRLTS